jgi:hypothetical protein
MRRASVPSSSHRLVPSVASVASIALGLLAPAIAGCPQQVPAELRAHGYERALSNVIDAPAGSPVRRAWAVVRYHVGRPVWGFMAEAERLLIVTRVEGEAPPAPGAAPGASGAKERDLVVRLGYRRAHWGEDSAPFLEWTDRPSFELRLAPDAHAIALSDDAGAHWSYVALDAGDEPFACFHTRVASDGREPFAVLPTTRELARSILASGSATDGRGLAHPGEAPDAADGWNGQELRGALRYACAHPDDATLGREVAAALVRETTSASIWDLPTRTKVVACLGAFAKTEPAVRATLLTTLRTAAPRALEQRSFAAEGLASLAEEDVQRALVADLERILGDHPRFGECDLAAREAWSLASVTTLRRAAPVEVEGALIRFARSDASCLGGPTMEVVRAQAVRALAALASEGARVALDALAGGCGGAPAKWPEAFENEWEVASKSDWSVAPVACWAAAAKARR